MFATSTGRGLADAKRAWLERNGFLPNDKADGPHEDLVYAHDKGMLRGLALIDDYAKNLTGWGSRGILLQRPWSENERAPDARIATDWPTAVDHVNTLLRPPSRPSIAEEAHAIVHGGRMDLYGHPYDNDTRIAMLWSSLFGWDVRPTDVWQAMTCVKLSRERTMPKRDNRVDVAGYALTGDLVTERYTVEEERLRAALQKLKTERVLIKHP